MGPDRHHLRHFLQQVVQREPGPFQLELRGFDLGEIEDVVDEIQQVVAGAAKDLHILVLLRERAVFASRSAMPMIAFIGVRIS